jgi:hypothetical protein
MASKNRPQRGSFNTRGRQKVAAQQAGRRAATPPTSSNALPPGRMGGPASRSPVGRPIAPMERVKVRDLGNSKSSVRTGYPGADRPSLPSAGKPSSGPVRIPRPSAGALSKAIGKPNVSRPSKINGRAAASVVDAGIRIGLGQNPGQALSEVAGGQAGAKLGSMVPGPAYVKAIGSGVGYLVGSGAAGRVFDNIQSNKGGQARPNQGRKNNDPYGVGPKEKAAPSVPKGLPNRNTKPTPTAPTRQSADPAQVPLRSSGPGGGGPNRVSGGSDIIRERPSASVASPSVRPSTGRPSAPTSAPKAPPAAPKAPATPAEPNMFNAPRTGVAKFRTDMNPLGKKIVGTTNFSKSVPSERGFDMTSDYSSSLSIPDKKKRKS